MKTELSAKLALLALSALAGLGAGPAAAANPHGDQFTYQGELTDNGVAVTGTYDFNISIYDDGIAGSLVGFDALEDVDVVDGIFTLTVDSGLAPFDGNEVWLDVEVREGSSVGAFTLLSPRQLITNAPFALRSKTVDAGGVDNYAIQDGAIDATKLAPASVQTSHLEIGSVNSGKIADGSIAAVDVDLTSIQARVAGSCAAGNSIRQINANGSVVCEADDAGGGGNGWLLGGNGATQPGSDYLGTADNAALILKVNNRQAIRIDPTVAGEAANINSGYVGNQIGLGVHGASIGGGGSAGFGHTIAEHNAFIGGGVGNVVSNGDGDFTNGALSTIAGGSRNSIAGRKSSIGGGEFNQIIGDSSTIPGGQANAVIGHYGHAAGFGSSVLHNGGWVWNDWSTGDTSASLETTGANQFLIRAEGGVGIGTNSPGNPFTVDGIGTDKGSAIGEGNVVARFQPRSTAANVAISVDATGAGATSSMILARQGSRRFEIASWSLGGSADVLDFNSYGSNDQLGKILSLIRTNPTDPAGIQIQMHANTFISGDLIPFTTAMYSLGSSSQRWAGIYSTSPLDVSSDARLKTDVQDLDYGLAQILALRPVSYRLRSDKHAGYHLGLIAQEVEQLVPEVVSRGNDAEELRSMRYAELIPVLIKSVQEQQVLIDDQARAIASLACQLESMTSRARQASRVRATELVSGDGCDGQ